MRTGFLKKDFRIRFISKHLTTVKYVLSFFFLHFFLQTMIFKKFKELLSISNYFKNSSFGKNICYFSLRRFGGTFHFRSARHFLRPLIQDNFGLIKAVW